MDEILIGSFLVKTAKSTEQLSCRIPKHSQMLEQRISQRPFMANKKGARSAFLFHKDKKVNENSASG
ncbi:hypothetical protein [Roseibium aquae]|uniref:hypothetical protein n=1 Tax=Roseibium aquae TaxID=1323746 RepID=UPI00123DDDAD|nr:hypothetical protein [Roseibium aquae]